jgi:hypothetical protein
MHMTQLRSKVVEVWRDGWVNANVRGSMNGCSEGMMVHMGNFLVLGQLSYTAKNRRLSLLFIPVAPFGEFRHRKSAKVQV